MFYRRNADTTWRIAERQFQAGDITVQEYNAVRARAGLELLCEKTYYDESENEQICLVVGCTQHHCWIFPMTPPIVATCGNCDRSWCEKCDPTPGPLCHFCHGYGYTRAEIIYPRCDRCHRTILPGHDSFIRGGETICAECERGCPYCNVDHGEAACPETCEHDAAVELNPGEWWCPGCETSLPDEEED